MISGLYVVLISAMLSCSSPEAERNAPEFSLKTLDGQVVSLSAQRGKILVLNFWATWCAPCRQEFPFLVQAYIENLLAMDTHP